jgi:hypothetical protein
MTLPGSLSPPACSPGPLQYEPPCPRCPLDLSNAPAPKRVPCRACGAERLTLFELESAQLKVPDVCMDDFRRVMGKATSSVAARELKRYEDFTKEFGSEGS